MTTQMMMGKMKTKTNLVHTFRVKLGYIHSALESYSKCLLADPHSCRVRTCMYQCHRMHIQGNIGQVLRGEQLLCVHYLAEEHSAAAQIDQSERALTYRRLARMGTPSSCCAARPAFPPDHLVLMSMWFCRVLYQLVLCCILTGKGHD